MYDATLGSRCREDGVDPVAHRRAVACLPFGLAHCVARRACPRLAPMLSFSKRGVADENTAEL